MNAPAFALSLFVVSEELLHVIIGNDLTTGAIEWALNGLERRAQVIANNVANSEVPNFQATRVEFEQQLGAALDAGRITRMEEPVESPTGAPAGANGNNVQMEEEMIGMLENNLMRSAMIEAFNYKAGLIRLAIRGQ
jgi:flagellar basal-body rod protein FlgB